jgi:hypothetical protein
MCSLSQIKAIVLKTRSEYDESVSAYLQTVPSPELIEDIKTEFIKVATNPNELFYGQASQAVIHVERSIQIPNLYKTTPWLLIPLDEIKAKFQDAFPQSNVFVYIKDYGMAWLHITISMDLNHK